MSVKVKVTMNRSVLQQLSASQKQALEMTAEAVKTDIATSAVVPFKVGTLERSAEVDKTDLKLGLVSIVYDTPYARRLYFHPEYDFRTDLNPNAQGRWMDTYIDGEKKYFAKETFAEFMRQLAGG